MTDMVADDELFLRDFFRAGAFGEAVTAPELLGQDATRQGYWERLASFLTRTEVSFDDLKLRPGVGGVPAEIRVALKSDPTFKEQLQKAMAGHLGALVQDVRDYFVDVVGRLRKKHGETTEVVLLIDSLERLRGTSVNVDEVHRSAETLFAGHADKLRLPEIHVVYTVPPFLKVRYPNLGALYSPGGLKVLPAVKIRDDGTGAFHKAGVAALARVVETRGDWRRLLGRRKLLEEIIRSSGGHLRDLLRLVAEVILQAESLPVPKSTVLSAISRVRNGFLPIANADAAWLERVAQTHLAELEEGGDLPDLARFLETHILCYHNDREWYDVHPLIADVVKDQVLRTRKRLETQNGVD